MNSLTRKMRLALTALPLMERGVKSKPRVARRPVVSVSGAALGAGVLVGCVWALVSFCETARATSSVGVTSAVLAQGRLKDEFDVKTKTGDWETKISTKGASDLLALETRVEPGGTYGWHSHPGPHLVIVKSGTATVYMGHDTSCTPLVVPAGSSYAVAGGHVHMVRNEGSEELVEIVVSILPAGVERRIDEPAPGHCP